MAARSPIGPAPVTNTVRGENQARSPVRSTCSHAFATTLVGSVRTPAGPSLAWTATAYSTGVVHIWLANPSRDLMPRSV